MILEERKMEANKIGIFVKNDLEKTLVLKCLEEKTSVLWRTGKKPLEHLEYESPQYYRIENNRLSRSGIDSYDEMVEYLEIDGKYKFYTATEFLNEHDYTLDIICEECGQVLSEEHKPQFFDGKFYCKECLDEITAVCNDCGNRFLLEEIIENEYGTYCLRCDENYTTCDYCGDRISIYNSYHVGSHIYCYDCYCDNRAINSYDYKPEPIFYGTDNFYMGVELEIDRGGEDDDNAERLLDIMNGSRRKIYCKHDGSLNDGFEVVSHPATLEEHKTTFNWEALMEEALDMGYKSHDVSTCGLHIHVNRNGFGNSIEEREKNIAKVVYFVEKHWVKLKQFSRRTDRQLEDWASRYGVESTVRKTYEKAKGNGRRYVAVNLLPTNTIEFRFFRGTLNYNTFIATLQMVHKICTFAMNHKNKDIERTSWSNFIKDFTEPELIQYLKERNIYTVEAEETEEN